MDLQNDAEEMKYWPGVVVRFYLGSVTAADVLAAAKKEDLTDYNPCPCSKEETDTANVKNRTHYAEGSAYFYLGEDTLLRGHSDEARAFFEKSIKLDTRIRMSNEYHGSVVELAHLAARQTKPTHDTHDEVHHPN
jgi:lipoprotein NlpI